MNATGDGSRQADHRFAAADAKAAARETEMVQRILAGALLVASHEGVPALSMGNVAAAAGVSRGTVYRYFGTRQVLLECMNERVQHCWERALHEAVRAEPAVELRVRLVMESLPGMAEVLPDSQMLFDNDPAYVLSHVQRHFPEIVQVVVHFLEPVLDAAEAVRAGAVTRHEAAELALRIALADVLVPAGRAGSVDQRVDAFWAFVGGRAREVEGMGARTSRVTTPLRAIPGLALK
ncbi:TetR/AcrR family transcriptional regulator [Streptomyces sp. bgisy027]|uniref:TetR/AcrR family transcriptional regulator n=1 Tax=Streptomyces sp. bgisy027 TaxID=3413770 RepID=UPI003D7640B4